MLAKVYNTKKVVFFSLLVSVIFALLTISLKVYASDDGFLDANKDLIQPATNGLIYYFFEMISSGLSDIIGDFAEQFDPTGNYFYTVTATGSADNAFFDFFYYLGYFFTLTVFAFSMFIVALSGFFENKNRAIELLVRLLVACLLIFLSRDIFDLMDDAFQNIWDTMSPVEDPVLTFEISWVDQTWKILIVLILLIAFIIEFVKFVLEIMERYIVVKLLYIASPSTMGLIVSRTTSAITINYLRMYFSQLLLLVFNRFFSFLLCAATTYVIAQSIATLEITPWLFLIASCKTAQRVDSYMKSLGLTVAQTGSAVLDSVFGAVGAVKGMMNGAQKGAGFVGALQMSAGAANNDYGLFKAGMQKQAFAKGGITGLVAPKSESDSLKAFADAGGSSGMASGTATSKEALANAMYDSYSRGRYGELSNFDSSTQTQAARKVLGTTTSSGQEAFEAATGHSTKDIVSARFGKDGSIEGTFKTGPGEKDISTFKVAAADYKQNSNSGSSSAGKGNNPVIKGGSIECADGQIRNIQTKGDITKAPDSGKFEYHEDGVSNLNSMTDFDIDDERLNELGASQYMIDRKENTLYVADDEGNIVYARGLETGNEMWASREKPEKNEDGSLSYSTPDIKIQDFAMGGQLEDYAPQGVANITTHKDKNSVVITTNPTEKHKDGTTVYAFGTQGQLKNVKLPNGSGSYKYVGRKVDLNNKNIRIIDRGSEGSLAVIARSKTDKTKVKP